MIWSRLSLYVEITSRLPPCRSSTRAFTLIELMVAVSIIGLLAGLAIPEANRSLQRSKVNEVALELAGWLESIKINSTSDVTCKASFQSNTTNTYVNGSVLFVVSSVQQAGIAQAQLTSPPCTQYLQNFRVGLSAISGTFQIISPTTLQFTRRGNLIATDANGKIDSSDIKIFLVGSSYLRCLRPAALLGSFRVGANTNATSINDLCEENSFQSF